MCCNSHYCSMIYIDICSIVPCFVFERLLDPMLSSHPRYSKTVPRCFVVRKDEWNPWPQKSHRVPKACKPAVSGVSHKYHDHFGLLVDVPARQPCIISSLPCLLEVMKMTSAPKLVHVSLRSCMLSGLPPRFFVSHKIILSGSMCLWMRPVIVGPKVFSWSEPIHIRNLEARQSICYMTVSFILKGRCIPIRALDTGG